MSNTDSLVLNLANDQLTENQHKQIVERVPIRCSFYNGLYFGEYYEPFLETPEHSHPQHEIVTLHFQESTQMEWMIEGRSQNTSIVDSSICLFPAHSTHRAVCQTSVNFSLLTLDLAQIASVAYEDVKVDRIELLSQVNVYDPVVHHIEQLLRLELQGTEFGNHLYIDSLTTALSIHLIRQYATQLPKQREFLTGLTPHQLRTVLEYIQANLDQNLSLESIAQVAGMSRYHFIRRFKQTMHESPYQYLIGQRIEQAKQLLKVSPLSIADTAIACGFANQSHLTKHFKQRVGITPQLFRRTTQQ